jgi:hypothetical protein
MWIRSNVLFAATRFAIKRLTESVVSSIATHIKASPVLPLMFSKVSS